MKHKKNLNQDVVLMRQSDH